MKSILDGVNQLLIEEHPVAGINYLLDGISCFFIDSFRNNDLDDNLKNDFYELIIRFKYQIIVMINTYFKLYEDSTFEITFAQKEKIRNKIKLIFSNTVNMFTYQSFSNIYLKQIFAGIFDIYSIVFSVNNLIENNIAINNFPPMNAVLATYKTLIEKSEFIKLDEIKNNINGEIKEGIEKLFNGIIDLTKEAKVNFDSYEFAMCGLLKILVAIYSGNNVICSN